MELCGAHGDRWSSFGCRGPSVCGYSNGVGEGRKRYADRTPDWCDLRHCWEGSWISRVDGTKSLVALS
nr:hypothetical protein JVH1_1012 [Rhodococcus sp. JVH1]